jgi:hypothetical protein
MEAQASATMHAGNACEVERLVKRLAQGRSRVPPTCWMGKERRLWPTRAEAVTYDLSTVREAAAHIRRDGDDA